jgi:arylsulfatase A-like enzyme/Flp pilus assembly protein TadD
MRWTLVLVLGFLLLPSTSVAQGNVILITIDSLRADHLETYGYEKLKTPAISVLAADGFTFEKAVIQIPLTTASHASILTGTYPHFHGIQDVVGTLADDAPTLVEWFRDQGYKTAAFVGSGLLLSQWGLNRGFQTYDDHFSTSTTRPTDFDKVERSAEQVVASALDWLNSNDEEPFLLWLNFSDPRQPHSPPAPYSGEYTSPYDGEIAYVDSAIMRLFNALKERKQYRESAILLTAPHGNSLGEHGEDSNGLFLYQSSLHVPLLMKLPDGKLQKASANRRIPGLVRSVDLAPTLIELFGGSVPKSMQGKSLLDFLTATRPSNGLSVYSETHYPRLRFGWSSLFSYCRDRYKLILSPAPELFDLEADPGELKNIYNENRALGEQLEDELQKFLSELNQPAVRSAGTDPKSNMEIFWAINESAAALQAGLLEKSATALQEVFLKEPNNPTAHHVLGSLYLEQGQYLLAVQEFRESLKYAPSSYENKINLSLAYLRAGLNGQAQLVLKEILEANPSDSVARQFLAISYAKQGNLKDAIRHGKIAVELRPLSASAHYNLGSYYLGNGEDAEAGLNFKKAVDIAPAHIDARTNLAFVLLRLNQFDEALVQAQEVLKLSPDNSLGHLYLGQAYLSKGMGEEAEAAFKRAKELDPQLTVPSLNR